MLLQAFTVKQQQHDYGSFTIIVAICLCCLELFCFYKALQLVGLFETEILYKTIFSTLQKFDIGMHCPLCLVYLKGIK